MGNSESSKQQLQENGVVNSNFVVQEQEYNVTKDVKIILYLMLAILCLNSVFKIFKCYKKQMERNIRKNLVLSSASIV